MVDKDQEYTEYINNHIKNVYLKSEEILAKLKDVLELSDVDTKQFKINILNHDNSKYSSDEFEPYRKYYFSNTPEEKKEAEKEYHIACKHHYMVNSHHPEYWIKDREPQEMDLLSILEMICDWEAVSMDKGTNTKEWYRDNQDIICLHGNTRTVVEEILTYLHP